MAQPPVDFGATEGQYGQQGQQHQFGQQLQQPGQPSQQFGSPGGQQGLDIKLEEGLTDEMRVVLHDLVQSVTACEWCAERCIDEGPEMSECIRLCRDVADLATLNVQLISRDSVFGPEAIEVFAIAAEACAKECARHGHRHCQECAEELSRAVQSTRKMLASFGQGGGIQGQQFGQPQSQQIQQPAGQSFGQSPGQQFGEPQSQQFGEPQSQQSQQPPGQFGTQGPTTGQQF